jgi:signal transduction histidine kinase
MNFLGRLVSIGDSGAIPERLGRNVRIANALALIGAVLNGISFPFDLFTTPPVVPLMDASLLVAFSAVWALNARGHHTAARVLLLIAANLCIIGGVAAIGGLPELRTMFFPLVLIPFFVFRIGERLWILVFVAVPLIAYFTTAAFPPDGGFGATVYEVYAPMLAWMMMITGLSVFAWVHDSAEDKLAHTRARAAQGARLAALGEMSSSIAHEIRNPLAAIHIAASQIVEHPDDRAQVEQMGERIQRIVMRASNIIEGLRTFSRDAGNDPLVATPVARIVADTLELCGKRFAERGVTLTIDVQPEPVVECRSTQLSQVLMNLLSNAYDAALQAPDDRWVRVHGLVHDDSVELAVTNSGPLIPMLVRARMFEPFFTTKSPDRGTGLGLSLSRGIVESHHGTLELDERAANTRFVIRIPAAQRPAAAAPSPVAAAS